MKYEGPLLVVENLEASLSFYQNVLGLQKIVDFGANVTLTGGVSLQTKESWLDFIHMGADAVQFGGNDAELYFEEDDFDAFLEKVSQMDGIRYVHPVQEHSWGQRGVRLYDPDGHIIEIGENMQAVVKRFMDSGMSVEETAKRMDIQEVYVRELAGIRD